jgi:glycine dehydrogenase
VNDSVEAFLTLAQKFESRQFFQHPLCSVCDSWLPAMSALGIASRIGRFRASPHTRWFIPSSRGLASLKKPASLFDPLDTFSERHIGPDDAEAAKMLETIGYKTMDDFIDATVPPKIRIASNAISNDSIKPFSESELKAKARALGDQNKVFKNFIGMGYHCAVVPPVIQRNVR